MSNETEQAVVEKTPSGHDREWATWWQGYWSDAPAPPRSMEHPRTAEDWRESAHEFDFGGEQ